MKLTLYHGSPSIIRKPTFGFGKPYNDYGLGFYCTEHLDLAKEWSVDEGRDGFANAYQIETDGLNVLHLEEPPFCILHWLSEWYPLKKGHDDEARRSYRDVSGKREKNGLYISRIMDEDLTADDLCL